MRRSKIWIIIQCNAIEGDALWDLVEYSKDTEAEGRSNMFIQLSKFIFVSTHPLTLQQCMFKIFCSFACSLIITFCIIYCLFTRQKFSLLVFANIIETIRVAVVIRKLNMPCPPPPQIRRWFESVRRATNTALTAQDIQSHRCPCIHRFLPQD